MPTAQLLGFISAASICDGEVKSRVAEGGALMRFKYHPQYPLMTGWLSWFYKTFHVANETLSVIKNQLVKADHNSIFSGTQIWPTPILPKEMREYTSFPTRIAFAYGKIIARGVHLRRFEFETPVLLQDYPSILIKSLSLIDDFYPWDNLHWSTIIATLYER